MPSNATEYNPKEFVCGAGAAFINISVTFPINKVMFRQQLYGVRLTQAIGQLQREGISKLYRGLLPPLLQKTTSMSIMFGMFDHYKLFLEHTTTWSALSTHSCAAMMAGCTEALLCPFERIQVLMQDKKFHGHFRNTVHAAVELRAFGINEYYRGLSVILLRNGPSNVAFFTLRKPIKELMPRYESDIMDLGEHFISGAILGAAISTACYPLNVIKTNMQARMGGEFHGIMYTFRSIFKERKFSLRKMFRGVHINFTRSLISWGIINVSYEMLIHSSFWDD